MPHPGLPRGPAQAVEVSIASAGGALLSFLFALSGQQDRIRIPARRAPARADELWRHTCFEAFLKSPGENCYRELNFSPSGEWAAYRFEGYRAGMAIDPQLEVPQLEIFSAAGVLELRTQVRLSGPLSAVPVLAVALAAVVESIDGTLSYWALRHAGAKPDFHHPEGFMLELAR